MLRRCLTLLVALLAGSSFAAPTDAQIEGRYRSILNQVRFDSIRATYDEVSSFGSRTSGSPAETATFNYAEKKLKALGARVRREDFTVTVPDSSAVGTLRVGSAQTKVYPLWPNLVRTSTCDVTGPLVYGGDGTLEALSHLDIRGRVVLLEFNSGPRWRNAAKLGAAAVVFIEPDTMPRAEAEAKFSGVPVDVPRFYLPLQSAGPVLEAAFKGSSAHLTCHQDWVQRTSTNLIADFDGANPAAKDERIALFTYADSMSVVPALAPGAEGIGGLAAMLEVARVSHDRRHQRPLTCILSGGHGLSLQGAREFIQKRLTTEKGTPWLTVTLDFSSGNQAIGSYARGWLYEYRNETTDPMRTMSRLLRSHADKLAPLMGLPQARMALIDAVNDGDSRTWKNNIPGKFALDCEPMVVSGVNALTFVTVEDSRDRVDTPFDTLDHVQYANVARQTQTLAVMLDHLLNDTSNKGENSDYKVPLDQSDPSTMTLTGGFATVKGQIVVYDPQKSFVPDQKVPGSIAAVLARQKTMMGVRGDMLQLTGDDAQFNFFGLPPLTAYAWTDQKDTRMGAFHIESKSGQINYAPTWNVPGFDAYWIEFPLKVAERGSPIVVFPCVPISLFDLVDPQSLDVLQKVRVLDATTGSTPRDFGIFVPPSDTRLQPDIEDTQILFLTSGQRFQLLGGSRTESNRLVLTASTATDEAGKGYVAPGGKPVNGHGDEALSGRFADVPLNSARDLCALDQERLNRFKKYRIVSQGVWDLHQQALDEIKLAEAAQANKDWPSVDRHARAAWGFALRAYPVIQTTANDVVNGVVFYLFLIIPFSYFLERLIIGNQLLAKQLVWSVGFFIASYVLLWLIHPAFEIVTNPTMIFVAFVMGALSLIVISFILGKFESSMRAVRAQQSGVVEVDIRRSSVAMAAFNLGVSNMRRRKARTVLTTLTLVVMTFIVLSFTSIVPDLKMSETPSDHPAKYSGILVRNPGLDPMQLATYRQVANEFAGVGTIVRRAYYYGADIGDAGVLSLQRAEKVSECRALLGMDPEEERVLRPQEALFPGGRWFKPGERNVVVLPEPVAEQLKIDRREVGKAKVTYSGEEYTVIGIADTAILRSMIDLDGDGALPPDFTLSRQYQELKATTNQAFRTFIRLDPANVFIIPATKALDLGADMRTIAVKFEDPKQTRVALNSLMPRLRLNLYASVPGPDGLEVKQFSVQQGSKSEGLLLIVVQLVIASVFVLNTMVASVYERTKEIGIFSSIGLAPNHIAMLFFAESLVYGILGAVIGYAVAQGTAKVIVATGGLPGLTLNFSSVSAVLSAVIVMAVVLGSTIYPARKAAQIAAPAMNEDVFRTEPEGDVWEIPMPFSINEYEAGPLTNFLTAWFRAYEGYTIGDFVTAETERVVAPVEKGLRYVVSTVTWLAPYDLGVSQRLQLVVAPSVIPGVYQLDLKMTRLAGDAENWPIVNQRFLATIRRQFLAWRTLKKEDRARYEQEDKREAYPA